MRTLSNVSTEEGRDYWHLRELETEQRLINADSKQLRVLYAELIAHYQRMGALFCIPSTDQAAT